MLQQVMIAIILFASMIFGSPLDFILKDAPHPNIEAVSTFTDTKSATEHGTNGLMMGYDIHPPVLRPSLYKFEPKTDKDDKSYSNAQQTESLDDVLSSSDNADTSTVPGQHHNSGYGKDNAAHEKSIDILDTADMNSDSTSARHDVYQRDVVAPMGYHNYAMVCASSKTHTDYCSNRRRGYYCSQNGYLNIHFVRSQPC